MLRLPARGRKSSLLGFSLCLCLLCGLPASADPYADGLKFFGKKDYRAAAACFGMALKNNPYDYNALYYSAIAFQYLGQNEQAKAAYGRLVEKFSYTAAGKNAQIALSRLDPRYLQSLQKSAAASPTRAATISGVPHGDGHSPDFNSLPAEDRVYFTHEDGQGNTLTQPVVEASVNNRGIRMIFDTGASKTTFGKDQLKRMGIQPPSGKPTGMSWGVGSSDHIKTWSLNVDLKVGKIERKNFQVDVQDELGTSALLGQDFFQDFRYTIDNGAKSIHFVKKGGGTHVSSVAPGSSLANDRYAVPFRREGKEMIVNVEVDGRTIPMFFDTGAANIVFTKKHLDQLSIRIPDDAEETTTTGVGGSTKAKRFPVRLMRCGPVERGPIVVSVVENAIMNHPLLGQSFLGEWQYTIDNDNNVIRFVRR